MDKKLVTVTVACGNCGYRETREREEDSSYDGLKCPNCECPMTDMGTDPAVNEEPAEGGLMPIDEAGNIIRNAIKEVGPLNNWGFVSLMSELFSKHQGLKATLDSLEEAVGERKANEWLCDVLVSSGMYTKDTQGNVTVINQ